MMTSNTMPSRTLFVVNNPWAATLGPDGKRKSPQPTVRIDQIDVRAKFAQRTWLSDAYGLGREEDLLHGPWEVERG